MYFKRSTLFPHSFSVSRLLGGAALVASMLMGALPAWSYEARAGGIVDAAGNGIQLRGVNWFGAETATNVVHGLWARNWQDMIDQMQQQGFNAVRLPFCPATLQGVAPSAIDYSRNPDLQGLDSLQVLDAVVLELSRRGMYVLLDHHTTDCQSISELWYTPGYSEAQWLDDLAFVARRYREVPGVIGLDIKNEPHGAATWGTGNPATDWNLAAERAAARILPIAPHWLIAVEGIGASAHCSSQHAQFWGGNLEPMACAPLAIPTQRLLLVPHIYGPDVHAQPYFSAPNFPDNMPAIWEQQFGRFVQAGHTLMLGEFGGQYGHGHPADVAWQNKMVDYLIAKNIRSGFYWSWNPNSNGTGGVLQDDWQTVRSDKVQLLQRLWGNVGGGAPTAPAPSTPVPPEPQPAPPQAPAEAAFAFEHIVDNDWGTGYCQRVKVRNTGSTAGEWLLITPIEGHVNSLWSALWLQQDNLLGAIGLDWNRTLAPGASTEFGFCAQR